MNNHDNEVSNISASRAEKICIVLILCVLIYFPLFSFLGTLPIRIWDESRLAINAIEMMDSDNPIVTTFEGKPDYWNSKPPLLIWLQVISMKLFGISELALRLPSALSALLTCMILFLFIKKITNSYMLPAMAVLILVTSMGYVSNHGVRTGDYDALLCLNVTAYTLCLLYYTFTNNRKYYYLFFLFLALAILTKGIAGLIILPGIALALIFDRKFVRLFKSPVTYYGIVGVLLVVGTYYGLREYYTPGYLNAVMGNEITGRYLDDVENHKEPFNYYFDKIIEYRYASYLFLLIVGILVNGFLRDKILARLSLYSTSISIVFLLIISSGISKMEHYDLPVYPFFAIITGIVIYSIFNVLRNQQFFNSSVKFNLLPIIFLVAILINPYRQIIDKWVKPKDEGSEINFYSLSKLLQKVGKSNLSAKQISIYHNGYSAHIDFYQHVFAAKGIESKYTDLSRVRDGEIIAIGDQNLLNKISSKFSYKVLMSEKFARLVKITRIKRYNELLPKSRVEILDNFCYSNCTPWKIELLSNLKSNETALSAFTDFENNYDCDDFRQHIVSDTALSGTRSIYINEKHIYSASFTCLLNKLDKYDQVEIVGKMLSEKNQTDVVAVLNIVGTNEERETQSVRLLRDCITENVWQDFSVHLMFNRNGLKDPELVIYFQSIEANTIHFDDLRITFMQSSSPE